MPSPRTNRKDESFIDGRAVNAFGPLTDSSRSLANLGTGPSSALDGMQLTVTSGTGVPTSGATVTVTFETPLPKVPRVFVRHANAAASAAGFYVDAADVTKTGLVIRCKVAPVISTAHILELVFGEPIS